MYCYPSIICWVIAVLCSNPLHPSYTPVVGALLTLSSLSVISNSTLLCEIDKCIGYWLSLMPTSTSMHPSSAPSLPPAWPAVVSVWQALGPRQVTTGLWRAAALRPSPCSLAPAGVSSGSPACQSDLRPTERKKTSYRSRFTSFLLGELDNAANKLTNISYFVIEIPHVLT